jgi:hypothetical protein
MYKEKFLTIKLKYYHKKYAEMDFFYIMAKKRYFK